jgi:hypothetical protein
MFKSLLFYFYHVCLCMVQSLFNKYRSTDFKLHMLEDMRIIRNKHNCDVRVICSR